MMRIPVKVARMSGPDDEEMAACAAAETSWDREERGEEQAMESSPPAAPIGRDEVGSEVELDWKDKYVRLLADFDNHKRHVASERERLAGIGREAVLSDVFPVVEHMDRAVKAARQNGVAAVAEGVEMVLRELMAVLEKHGVRRIETEGAAFNPALHEAVAAVASPGAEEGAIVSEVRPGFEKEGRVLRAAQVVVAK